jgi:hypothetical protein
MLDAMHADPAAQAPSEPADDNADDDARNFFDEELEHWIAAGST